MSDETWKKTACVLCSLNCGLRVQTGGPDGRQILKLHGDDEHPVSKGYLCEKAQLDLLALRRIRIGRVTLSDLPEGQWRYLAGHERF